MKIFLIILFFVVLIHKPTYVMRRTNGRVMGARIPLWVAIVGLLICEPETFAIVPKEIHDQMWEIAQEKE